MAIIYEDTWPVHKQNSGMLTNDYLEAEPYDDTPRDPDYPNVAITEAVMTIASTFTGRDVITTDRSRGEDSVTAGWATDRGLGDVPGSGHLQDWLNCDRRRLRFYADYYMDELTWSEIVYALPFQINVTPNDGGDAFFYMALSGMYDYPAYPDPNQSIEINAVIPEWDDWIDEYVYVMTPAMWKNQRVRFQMDWLSGTMSSDGNDVAADGEMTLTLINLDTGFEVDIYTITGKKLYVSWKGQYEYHNPAYPERNWDGVPENNHIASYALGWYGFCGECERFVIEALDEEAPVEELPSTRFLLNRNVTVRTISDAARRQKRLPRTLAQGLVRGYQASQDLTFHFDVRDGVDAAFGSSAGETMIPKRVITTAHFPNCNAEVTAEPVEGGEEGEEDDPITVSVGAGGLPVPIIYGEITDTQFLGGVDYGDGQCPGLYVGDTTLSGTKYRTFLIAGHACKAIDEIYVDNDPQGLATVGEQGIWLVPKHTDWMAQFTTPYRDLGGHRYTVVYGKAGEVGPDKGAGLVPAKDDGSTPLAFSVRGIETKGDGTGQLITELLLQYRHCMQNWIVGNYTTGDWLQSPSWAGSTEKVIDDRGFCVAHRLSKIRIEDGYRGDFIIGSTALGPGNSRVGGEFVSARELVARFNVSCDVKSGIDRYGRFAVTMLNDAPEMLDNARVFNEVQHIVKGTFDVEEQFDHLFNAIPYKHTQDYFNRDARGWRWVDNAVDYTSVENYTRREAPERVLYMIRGWNRSSDSVQYQQGTRTAENVIGWYLGLHHNPPRRVRFQITHEGQPVELGDIIKVTHYGGISATGWVERPMMVVRHDTFLIDRTIDVEAIDLGDFFPVITEPEDTVIPAGSIMVGGWGGFNAELDEYDGHFAYLSHDGTIYYPQPPSAPTSGMPGEEGNVTGMCRTSDGHVGMVGGNFLPNGVQLFQASDLTVLSNYTGDGASGWRIAADGLGYWYVSQGGLSGGPTFEVTRLNAASEDVVVWTLTLPAQRKTGTTMAVSDDGQTLYIWLNGTTSPESSKYRVHQYSLSGSGSYVGLLHPTDYCDHPGENSLLGVPGSTDMLVAYNRLNTTGYGSLQRLTSSGTVVWTAGTPAGSVAADLDWFNLATGLPGGTYFLAWAYDESLNGGPPDYEPITSSTVRYVWFDYATGTPDTTRNFTPDDGNGFMFDSQLVVLQEPIALTPAVSLMQSNYTGKITKLPERRLRRRRLSRVRVKE